MKIKSAVFVLSYLEITWGLCYFSKSNEVDILNSHTLFSIKFPLCYSTVNVFLFSCRGSITIKRGNLTLKRATLTCFDSFGELKLGINFKWTFKYILYRRTTMNFPPNLYIESVWKRDLLMVSMNRKLQQEKHVSVMIWAPECCFRLENPFIHPLIYSSFGLLNVCM